jgi:hypothetical protein
MGYLRGEASATRTVVTLKVDAGCAGSLPLRVLRCAMGRRICCQSSALLGATVGRYRET